MTMKQHHSERGGVASLYLYNTYILLSLWWLCGAIQVSSNAVFAFVPSSTLAPRSTPLACRRTTSAATTTTTPPRISSLCVPDRRQSQQRRPGASAQPIFARTAAASSSATRLYWFGRKKDSDEEEEATAPASEDQKTNDNAAAAGDDDDDDANGNASGKGISLPFFARRGKDKDAAEGMEEEEETATLANVKEPEKEPVAAASAAAVATAAATSATTAAAADDGASSTSSPSSSSPQSVAAALRAQAEKARLEAERMDAELTLQKIARLEKEIASETKKAKKKQEQNATTSSSTGTNGTNSGSSSTVVDDLQREMDALQAKLRGETPKPQQPPTTTSTSSSSSSASPSSSIPSSVVVDTSSLPSVKEFSQEAFDETLFTIEMLPAPLKKILAGWVKVDYTRRDGSDVNATELAVKIDRMTRFDFSDSKRPKPTFTARQIQDKIRQIEESNEEVFGALNNNNDRETTAKTTTTATANATATATTTATATATVAPGNSTSSSATAGVGDVDFWTLIGMTPPDMSESGNLTQTALQMLEMEYYLGFDDKDQFIADFAQPLLEVAQDSNLNRLFPKCTRKSAEMQLQGKGDDEVVVDGKTVAQLAVTEQQVRAFASDILPAARDYFVPSSSEKPHPIPGGYVIRGNVKNESAVIGDALIELLDAELQRSASLKDKMTVCYVEDYTQGYDDLQKGISETVKQQTNIRGGGFLDDDDWFTSVDDMDSEPAKPCLFVLGPSIVPDRNRFLLSTVTAAGLATSWYLSIYPFLLNADIASRVEDQLALADDAAAMVGASAPQPDLAFLTEQSLPLFLTFLAIQFLHEVGHRLAASANGVELTFPTLVPSIITGITSSVTTFKTPPKNKQAMFDVAVAGPALGMLASLLAICLGGQLTLASGGVDTLPALPLQILRQSTLGGGILDWVLGNDGALSVPQGALGTAELAQMTIALHPVAVAGFIGLIVNALSLLPIGTTDGGRMTMTLFGREGKQSIGGIVLFALLVVGFFGSDLFLFYFAFCMAFQTGNEIPARNEVDKVPFSRVLVATAAYALCFLALVPFQS